MLLYILVQVPPAMILPFPLPGTSYLSLGHSLHTSPPPITVTLPGQAARLRLTVTGDPVPKVPTMADLTAQQRCLPSRSRVVQLRFPTGPPAFMLRCRERQRMTRTSTSKRIPRMQSGYGDEACMLWSRLSTSISHSKSLL